MMDLAFVLRTSMEHKPRIENEGHVNKEDFLRIFYGDTKERRSYPTNCGNCGGSLLVNVEKTRYCNPCTKLPQDNIHGHFYPSS